MDAASLTTDPATEWVRRARAGDHGAFEALYRQQVGHVYAVCVRMTADAERAATLTQDTFVQAWEGLDGFREDAAFSTWLHRIAVNVVLMALRAERRREARIETTDDPEAGAPTPPPPEMGAGLDLARALAALPPRARAVLVLYDVEGYRHAEIADRMGIAEGTSKAHLHRARMLLQASLSDPH